MKLINFILINLYKKLSVFAGIFPACVLLSSSIIIVNYFWSGKLTFVLNDLNELSLDKLSKLNISELITDLFVWVIAFPIFFPIFFIILIILLNKKLELVAFISKWAIVAHLWITSYWCVSTLRIISSELGKELNVDSKDILYSNIFFNLKRFFNSEELKKLTELYVGSDYIKDNEFIKMLNDFLTSHPGVGWGELKIKVMEFVAIVDASKIAANQAAHDSVVMTWIGGFFIIMVSVFMFKKSGLIEYLNLNPYTNQLEAYNVLAREMLKLRVDHELLRLLLGDLQENMDNLKYLKQFDGFSAWAIRCIYNLAIGYQIQKIFIHIW
jgi:hypothetical protein